MKPLLTAFALIAILFSLNCRMGKRLKGNGNLESENRNISSATKIKVQSSIDVILDSGATSIRVEADENLLPYIITEVDDNWLEIKLKRNLNFSTSNPMRVYITTPTIYNVRVSGSGNVSSEKKFWSKEPISFDIAGSGDITIDVNAPKVDADIAGSGNLTISGETRDVDVSIAGSGNFRGTELKAENASLNIVGSGDAYVFADVKLNAKIVGSGNVKYKGNAVVSKKVMGSGKVVME